MFDWTFISAEESSDQRRGNMHKLFKLVPLVVLLIILAACGGGSSKTTQTQSTSSNPSRSNLKFYVSTHGQSSDPFCWVVKKAVDQAGKDMCLQVVYEAPASATFDVVAIAHLIDSVVAAHP